MKLQTTYTLFLFLSAIAMQLHSQQCADSLFATYFARSQAYANAYPREKAYLHFDNTSYYIGDTIWYKAYVTATEQNKQSQLSVPLYVELLDQLGNISERQIIQLQAGEGNGQFILNTALFSGYYEIRAYTKWMLAFNEKQYFSRTFPIYRKRRSEVDDERSIITYRMDHSMKQRPLSKEKSFTLRFFPEGGQLVQGVASVVAFESINPKEGKAAVSGTVYDQNKTKLAQFTTLHDGMGCFTYTPTDKQANAVVTYQGKEYSFPLPKALPEGYVLNVTPKEKALDICIRRNSIHITDTLALFVSHQGHPITYQIIDFQNQTEYNFQLSTQGFPGGVTQLSLIKSNGAVLCERFAYVMPTPLIQLTATTPNALYYPFEPIEYHISMKDNKGNPLKGHFSVAIRDALNSDYQDYDHNIYTDMLLTSDLKGYIHQPGYYFANNSPRRRIALDILLLIRGWRKYDMQSIISDSPEKPIYLPEKKLTLHGQVRSFLRNKEQKNIYVNVIAQRDSLSAVGSTTTDSLGYFHIPMDAFSGSMEALIQTRRKGKKLNRETNISLFRNFAPELRRYSFEELHPKWKDMSGISWWTRLSDSLYLDSIMGHDAHVLDQVIVKAKRTKYKKIRAFEQSVRAYYDIPRELDRIRDEGKFMKYFPSLMETLNSNIHIQTSFRNNAVYLAYNNRYMQCAVNGVLYPTFDRELFIDKSIDAIKSVMICDGASSRAGIDSDRTYHLSDESIQGHLDISRISPFEEGALKSYLEGTKSDSELESISTVCYITTIDNWDPEKRYQSRGIRYTQIQGYSQPIEFYSPFYPDISKGQGNDHRRTLYWNPKVTTDSNGEAVIRCNNANSSTFLTISCETLYDGQPAAINAHSIKY